MHWANKARLSASFVFSALRGLCRVRRPSRTPRPGRRRTKKKEELMHLLNECWCVRVCVPRVEGAGSLALLQRRRVGARAQAARGSTARVWRRGTSVPLPWQPPRRSGYRSKLRPFVAERGRRRIPLAVRAAASQLQGAKASLAAQVQAAPHHRAAPRRKLGDGGGRLTFVGRQDLIRACDAVRRRSRRGARDAPNPQARNLAQRSGAQRSAPGWSLRGVAPSSASRLGLDARRRRSWEQLLHPSATLAARAQPTQELSRQHACTPIYALPTCNSRPAPLGALLESRGALCFQAVPPAVFASAVLLHFACDAVRRATTTASYAPRRISGATWPVARRGSRSTVQLHPHLRSPTVALRQTTFARPGLARGSVAHASRGRKSAAPRRGGVNRCGGQKCYQL